MILIRLSRITAHSETLEEKELPEVGENTGVPNHFKNKADGLQSIMRGMLNELAMQHDIDTVHELVDGFRALYQDYCTRKDNHGYARMMPVTFIDYFPCEDRQAFRDRFCIKFTADSYASPLLTCRSYEFRVNDWRQKRNLMNSDKTEYSYLTLKALHIAILRYTKKHNDAIARIGGDGSIFACSTIVQRQQYK